MVRTLKPDFTDPQWLNAIGHISNLQYGSTFPGGADQLSCVLQVPPTVRTNATDPGRWVEVWRGGSRQWFGKLNEPQPGVSGSSIAAHGAATLATDYCAVYVPLTNWTLNEPVNEAIARGLPWRNPGITAGWLAQQVDSGSQRLSDFLNSVTVPSGQGWLVDPWNVLNVSPLPTVVNRLLISTSPVARTIAADITTVFLKYTQSDDGQGNVVTGLTVADNQEDIDLHGPTETYSDLSNAGVMSAAAAQAVGNDVLLRYQRAAWAGPFTVRFGQLLTTGGTPIDLGCERAGTVARLLVTDAPFGGESYAGVIEFIIGAYAYDDDAQLATITPMLSSRTDFASLLTLIDPYA